MEQAHTVLHSAMEQAVEWGHVGRNVAEAVRVPRPERREMKTRTAEQVAARFEVTADDRWHALWVLLATTGPRLGEAMALGWEHVDLQTGRLQVQRALQRQRGNGLVLPAHGRPVWRPRRTLRPAGAASIPADGWPRAARAVCLVGQWLSRLVSAPCGAAVRGGALDEKTQALVRLREQYESTMGRLPSLNRAAVRSGGSAWESNPPATPRGAAQRF